MAAAHSSPLVNYDPLAAAEAGPVTYYVCISVGFQTFSVEQLHTILHQLKTAHGGNRIVIVIGDTLQRHNFPGHDSNEVIRRLEASAKHFIEEYLNLTIGDGEIPPGGEIDVDVGRGHTVHVEFIRWDELQRSWPKYSNFSAHIVSQVKQSQDLLDALAATAYAIKRKRKTREDGEAALASDDSDGSTHPLSSGGEEEDREPIRVPRFANDSTRKYLIEESACFAAACGVLNFNRELATTLEIPLEHPFCTENSKIVYTGQPSDWLRDICQHLGSPRFDIRGAEMPWVQSRGTKPESLTYLTNYSDGIGQLIGLTAREARRRSPRRHPPVASVATESERPTATQEEPGDRTAEPRNRRHLSRQGSASLGAIPSRRSEQDFAYMNRFFTQLREQADSPKPTTKEGIEQSELYIRFLEVIAFSARGSESDLQLQVMGATICTAMIGYLRSLSDIEGSHELIADIQKDRTRLFAPKDQPSELIVAANPPSRFRLPCAIL